MPDHLARAATTVLVVDDEHDVLDGCLRLLARLGYTTLSAATQAEALRLAESHTGEIHLVITDVVGHYMNGRELAAKLALRHPKIRCLLMSGYPAELLLQRGLIDRTSAFLQKPFERGTFEQQVHAALAVASN